MDYESYQVIVESSFESPTKKKLNQYDVSISYEEFFKWEWFASKQKVFSFTSYVEHVTLETIRNYSALTYKYCKENYRGLPRGLQTGFMSFSVIACQKVDEDAIKYVTDNAHLHFAAFEIPLIYDLEKECLYALKKQPTVGCLYNQFKKDYIKLHFDV